MCIRDSQFGAVEALLTEHASIESALADPAVHADPQRARALGRRYAELGRVVAAYRAWQRADGDAAAAAEMAEDPAIAAELPALSEASGHAAETLRRLLVPRDPDDARDAILEVKAGEGVWAHLKYEGGVHRVQRVPVTESQGRIHTSAAGVVVLPEVEDEAEVQIDPADLRIDVYRSSGPGGQSVNTTDSAVRT